MVATGEIAETVPSRSAPTAVTATLAAWPSLTSSEVALDDIGGDLVPGAIDDERVAGRRIEAGVEVHLGDDARDRCRELGPADLGLRSVTAAWPCDLVLGVVEADLGLADLRGDIGVRRPERRLRGPEAGRWADASVFSAAARSRFRSVVAAVARTSPLSTVSPTLTLTSLTGQVVVELGAVEVVGRRGTGRAERESVACRRRDVPVAATSSLTSPVVAALVRNWVVLAELVLSAPHGEHGGPDAHGAERDHREDLQLHRCSLCGPGGLRTGTKARSITIDSTLDV